MVPGTAQPLGSPTLRAAPWRHPTSPSSKKHRLIHCSSLGIVNLFITVCSIPLFDCTGKSPAWGVIHPVRIPEMPGAAQHPIPAPVGRMPADHRKGSSYKYL